VINAATPTGSITVPRCAPSICVGMVRPAARFASFANHSTKLAA
jgi:hypothetical protein